jgi:hypothetical protein
VYVLRQCDFSLFTKNQTSDTFNSCQRIDFHFKTGYFERKPYTVIALNLSEHYGNLEMSHGTVSVWIIYS